MNLKHVRREERCGFHDTPVYRKFGDNLLLIGVVHTDFKDFLGPRAKLKEFKTRIAKLDHLAFEGTQEVHETNIGINRRNFETVAFRFFSGKKHFLDDGGVDYISLLQEQGIPPSAFYSFKALPPLPEAIVKAGGNPEKFVASMKLYFKVMGATFERLDRPESEKIAELSIVLFDSLAKAFPNELGTIGHIFGAFQYYLARVRDLRIYGPRIAQMNRMLDGRKGVVMGAGHIEPIECILKGETTGIADWKAYVGTLDEDIREGISIVEEFANGCMSR